MYQIGEFSKLTNLSIRTLRYYNEIGLLIPEDVDIYTSYRYYGDKNIRDAKIINELKEAGFSLEEIKDNWNNFNEEILDNKKKELYQEINLVNEKIKKIDKLRNHLNNGKISLEEIKKTKTKRL